MRVTNVRQLALSIVTLVGISACSSGVEADLFPSIAVIHGVVRDPNGTPVAGVFVQVFIDDAGKCTAQPEWLAGRETTHTDGRYSVRGTFLHIDREEMCVWLRVRPRDGSGLREGGGYVGTVVFTHQPLTPPLDSLKADVVLEFEEAR
jgi:hypothetical protein